MRCPNCHAEMMIDQIINGATYYVCMNSKCPNYRRAMKIDHGKIEDEIAATIMPYNESNNS